VILLATAAFLFAVVMQPIFVWIICARIKRTNALLLRLETKLSQRPR
jgi:isoprenylcysteine carboxyl methyltransferase (ICMT) family protein YpbQ